MTLTEFLLARIAEDERASLPGPEPESWCDRAEGAHYEHARVLAECEAKRRIVEWHDNWPILVEQPPKFETSAPPGSYDYTVSISQQIEWMTQVEYVKRFGPSPPTAPILRILAQPYAGHEDFDPSWRL